MVLVVSTAKKNEAPLESTAGNADGHDGAADNSDDGSSDKSSSSSSSSSNATSNEGGDTTAVAATADAAAEDPKSQRRNPVLPVTVGILILTSLISKALKPQSRIIAVLLFVYFWCRWW